MKIYSIQSTNLFNQKTNFKGLWGNVIESKHIGEETMYGGEVSINRYSEVQEYHPFSDETPEMTLKALQNHSYIEETSAPFIQVTAKEVAAKIMPKLAISAQEFVDYITGAIGKDFLRRQVEAKLKNANLIKYLK